MDLSQKLYSKVNEGGSSVELFDVAADGFVVDKELASFLHWL